MMSFVDIDMTAWVEISLCVFMDPKATYLIRMGIFHHDMQHAHVGVQKL